MRLRFQPALLASLLCLPLSLCAQAPVGQLYSTVARVRGQVAMASGGTTVLSGSSIESGEQPASLVLNRGGNLNICQHTSVAVSASANGRDLMFSFGSGNIESRYSVAAASDVIITPDFRFVITGPGEFDLDVGITPNGDTCVHSLRASTGGVIVNEQMGDGTYQVKPSDFVVFRKGRIANVEVNPRDFACGCPAPKPSRQETYVAKVEPTPAPVQPPAPAPRSATSDQHVVVEAPFVFSADGIAPPVTARVMRLHLEPNQAFADLHPAVQPPAPRLQPVKRGFWHRLVHALFE